MAAIEHPTTDEIRQELKNRLLDIDDQARALATERIRVARALDVMSGNVRKPGRPPAKRGPGRPPKRVTA